MLHFFGQHFDAARLVGGQQTALLLAAGGAQIDLDDVGKISERFHGGPRHKIIEGQDEATGPQFSAGAASTSSSASTDSRISTTYFVLRQDGVQVASEQGAVEIEEGFPAVEKAFDADSNKAIRDHLHGGR